MNFFPEDKLKKLLASAYYEKENIEVGRGWQTDTMRHIRSLGMLKSELFEFMIEKFVWKFAAAACVVAIVLSVYTFQADFQTEYEMAKLFMEDPVEFTLVQSFGIL